MTGKPTYAGKIAHTGVQKVEAPLKSNDSKGKGTVVKGNDLRNKK